MENEKNKAFQENAMRILLEMIRAGHAPKEGMEMSIATITKLDSSLVKRACHMALQLEEEMTE